MLHILNLCSTSGRTDSSTALTYRQPQDRKSFRQDLIYHATTHTQLLEAGKAGLPTIQSIDPVKWWNCCEPFHRVFTVARPKSPILTVMSSVRKISEMLLSEDKSCNFGC